MKNRTFTIVIHLMMVTAAVLYVHVWARMYWATTSYRCWSIENFLDYTGDVSVIIATHVMGLIAGMTFLLVLIAIRLLVSMVFFPSSSKED